MEDNRIISYENYLLKKEKIIRTAFVVDVVVAVLAVAAYVIGRFSEFPFCSTIILPVILAGVLLGLLNRAELKHLESIKQYRKIE